VANASAAREPKFTVASAPGTIPAVSRASEGPSEVNSGTVIPLSSNRFLRCSRYVASLP
jgi:hypothetical protein